MLSPELLELARTMPKTIIRPSRGWVSLRLRDVWAYCELVLFLTWRDISVRYKQTLLGAALRRAIPGAGRAGGRGWQCLASSH